jgi:hypothetical protein
METLISLAIGIGLAAASGFRVFVPLLALSLAFRAEWVAPNPGLAWLASTPALIALAIATGLEVVAYYVPWLDHALDGLATPAAVTAGVLLTASVVTGVDPLTRWALAVIVGGGVAGTVQGATVVTRAISGATTAGLANPVVATGELVGAVILAVLAVLLPFVAVAMVLIALGLTVRWWRRRRRQQSVAIATA